MLDFFEELNSRKKFIIIDFDNDSFHFLSEKRINLNPLIESFLQNLNKEDENIFENNNSKDIEKTIIFIYENEKYEIFKNPINFKLFYEDKILLKAYNAFHLKKIIIQLSNYYYFYINNNIENDINHINILEPNFKEVILYPYFTQLFFMLNYKIELNDSNINQIKIKKELLEPLQLYIEKKELIKKVGNSNDFNISLLDDELIFIFNKERKQFIDKLDQYAKSYTIEPMTIIGNNGIGKSLTLQFYSSIKLEGFYKLYFNLKLFEEWELNYFFIELIRGFLSKDKNKIKDDFNDYIECVNYMQTLKNLNRKNFFDVLKELINYIEIDKKKYIIILDQFKYEYINNKDFDSFKNDIDKEQFRLIICCSLNDGEVKNRMFINYDKETLLFNDSFSIEENIAPLNKNEGNIIDIGLDNNNDNDENTINLQNIYILKKRRLSERLLSNKDNSNKRENPLIKINQKEEYNKNNSENNIDDFLNNNKSYNNNDTENRVKDVDNIFEPKYICELPIIFPEYKIKIIQYNTTPTKIYINNLVDLRQIIKEKESEEIYEFMSNFNYLPKYYNKFLSFRISIKNNNNNSFIIDNFKKEIKNKIIKNLRNFYIKSWESDNFNNDIYKYITKLKIKIDKYFDKRINLNKLYKFSKKYPMKYIIIKSEDNSNSINFDDSIINNKFKINFSFPFIEFILNSMIEEYDNNNKICIKDLSGSAFGKALELKIRKYIDELKEKIAIRKVWCLGSISDKVKKSKLNEIANKTLNSSRYKDLEDIFKSKPLKDFNIFYFHQESQDNPLIDSILLIHHNNSNYSIISFQIAKYKKNEEIKTIKQYKNYLIKEVKAKFEQLYNIKIIEIYLYFILNNGHIKNNDYCLILDNRKIKYIFFSIDNNSLFEERNNHKIENLIYLEKKEALIYSEKINYIEENKNNLKFDPSSIEIFENELYNLSKKYEKINYESIRKSYFKNNFGLKIGNQLKNEIIKTIKAINDNKKNFYILYLFSFPFNDIYKYYENDDHLFILKYNKVTYICYKDNFYEIDFKKTKLKSSFSKGFKLDIKDILKIHYTFNIDEEIDISSIKDLKENSIVYLYKIYYID